MSNAISSLFVEFGATTDAFFDATNAIRNEVRAMEDVLKPLKTVAADIGEAMTVAFTVPLAAFGAAAFEAASQVEEGMDTIRAATGATGDALQQLGDNFNAVLATVPNSIGDVATAISDLTQRTGLAGQPLQDLATQMLNVSRLTKTDINETIAASTRVFADWGITVQDQGNAMDFMFKTSQQTGIGFTTLARDLQQFGVPLREMGFNFQQSAALLGSFEKSGVNADAAMGALRKSLATLAKAGVSDPAAALQDLIDKIKSAGTVSEANAEAVAVFGAKAGPTLAAAIKDGKFEIDALVDSINASHDTINNAANDSLSFSQKLDILKNSAALALAPVGSEMIDALTRLLPQVQSALKFIGDLSVKFVALPPSTQDAILGVAAFAAGIGPAVIAGTKLFGVISTVIGVMSQAGISITGFNAALSALSLLTTVKSYGDLSAAVSLIGSTSLAATAGLVALAAAVGVAIGMFANWLLKITGLQGPFDTLVKKIVDSIPVIGQWITGQSQIDQATQGTSKAQQQLVDALAKRNISVDAARLGDASYMASLADLVKQQTASIKAANDAATAVGNHGKAAKLSAEDQQKLDDLLKNQRASLQKLVDTFQSALAPADTLNKKLADLSRAGVSNDDLLKVYTKDIVDATDKQLANGIAVTGMSAKLYGQAAALQTAAQASKDAEAAAKKLQGETDNLVNSVTGESDKGTALAKALETLMDRHVDLSLIVDKLGKQTLAYMNTLATMKDDIPLVVIQIAAMEEANEELAAGYAKAIASMNSASVQYSNNLKSLSDLQAKFLADSFKDETQAKIDAINEQLKADTNYRQFQQDAAAALLQTQKDADDAAAAYYQTTVNIKTAIDEGYSQQYINDLVKLGNQQLDEWQKWSKEHQQIINDMNSHIASNQKTVQNQWTQMTNKMSSDFASAVSDTLISGKSFSAGLTKIFQDLATNLLKIMVQGVFTQIMSGFSNLLGGMSSSLAGSLGGLLGGASGGIGGMSGIGGAAGGGIAGLAGAGGLLSTLWSGSGPSAAALESYVFGSGALPTAAGGLEGALGLGGGAGLLGLGAATIPVIGGAIAGVGLLISQLVGQGRKTANEWVQNDQNPFGTQLETLVNAFDASSASGSLTLDQANQAETSLTDLIQTITTQASQFASQGGENQTVIDQFWNTMTTDFGSNFQKIYDDFNNEIAKLQAAQAPTTPNTATAITPTDTTSGLTISSDLTNDAVTQLSTNIQALTDATNTLVAHISPTGLLPATGLATSASQIFADSVTQLQGIFTDLENRWDAWMAKLETVLPAVTGGTTNGIGGGAPVTVNVNYQLEDGSIQINGVDMSTLNIRDLIETQLLSDAQNDTRGFGTQLKQALGIA